MLDEKWLDIISRVEEKFDILEHEKEDLMEIPGTIEYIIFVSPLGKVKLERTVKPLVLDKKTNYSNRIGGNVSVEYVYSDTETVDKFKAYKWDDNEDDWTDIDADADAFID